MTFELAASAIGLVGAVIGATRWALPRVQARARRLRPTVQVVVDNLETPKVVRSHSVVFMQVHLIADKRPITITGLTFRSVKGLAILTWDPGVPESPEILCFGLDEEHIRRKRSLFVPFPVDVEPGDALTTSSCLRVRPVAGRKEDQQVQVEVAAISADGTEVGRTTFAIPAS